MLVWGRYIFSFIFILLLFAIPIIYEYIIFRHKKGKIKFWKGFFRKYGLTRLEPRQVLYGILLSFGIFAVNVIFVFIMSLFFKDTASSLASNLATNFVLMPIFYSAYLLISAIAEEFFFRAFLTSYLGIWFSSLIFALLHFSYGSALEIVGAFILGLILAIIWEKKRNFYIIAIAHFLQNIYSILILIRLI